MVESLEPASRASQHQRAGVEPEEYRSTDFKVLLHHKSIMVLDIEVALVPAEHCGAPHLI